MNSEIIMKNIYYSIWMTIFQILTLSVILYILNSFCNFGTKNYYFNVSIGTASKISVQWEAHGFPSDTHLEQCSFVRVNCTVLLLWLSLVLKLKLPFNLHRSNYLTKLCIFCQFLHNNIKGNIKMIILQAYSIQESPNWKDTCPADARENT